MIEQEKIQTREIKSRGHLVRLVLLMILAVILVVFAIQNSNEVFIKLLFWEFQTSMALALVICIVSGFILSLLYSVSIINGKNNVIRDKENEIARLKKEATRHQPEFPREDW